MTQFDPVPASNGALTGWTTFGGGFDIGVDSGYIVDRYVPYSGGGVDWYFARALYDTATASRADHIFTGECIATTGNGIRVYANSNAGATNYNEIVLNADGTWEFNSESGGITSGSGSGVSAGVSFDVEVDGTTAGTVVCKVDGSTVFTSSTNVRTGLYVGLFIGGTSHVGVFDIGPAAGGGATYVPPAIDVPRVAVNRSSRW